MPSEYRHRDLNGHYHTTSSSHAHPDENISSTRFWGHKWPRLRKLRVSGVMDSPAAKKWPVLAVDELDLSRHKNSFRSSTEKVYSGLLNIARMQFTPVQYYPHHGLGKIEKEWGSTFKRKRRSRTFYLSRLLLLFDIEEVRCAFFFKSLGNT
jgi:hypothetical protein